MARICLWLMFLGCVVGLFAAALFEAMARPSDGGYLISSIAEAGVTAVEPTRYAVITALGAAMGALGGSVLHLAGARVQPQRRVGLTAAVGLAGCAVGVLPAIVAVAAATDLPDWLSPLTLYAITGTLGYCLAVAAVYLTLRIVDDRAARSTTRATALLLPVGALIATVAGVGSAWMLGFATVTSTWVVVTTLVVLILSATFAVARAMGLRQHRPE